MAEFAKECDRKKKKFERGEPIPNPWLSRFLVYLSRFLLGHHLSHCRPNGQNLYRWLVEVEHWGPEMAHQLTQEFEFGVGLLALEEGHRQWVKSKPREGMH